MFPQLGPGTGIPSPRKLSEASTTIATPTPRSPIVSIGGKMCGTMCRRTIRVPPDPEIFAAET